MHDRPPLQKQFLLSEARLCARYACSRLTLQIARLVLSGPGVLLGTGRGARRGVAVLFACRTENFDPLKVEDDASVSIRYLTGGVLVRLEQANPDAGTRTRTIVESLEGRQRDHFQVAQRNLVF